VKSLTLVLLTCRAALGVFDSVTPLRLVDAGVPRENLALMSSVLPFVGIGAQLYVSTRYFGGGDSKPLLIWLNCYFPRLLLGLVSLGLVVTIPGFKADDGSLPTWLYGVMLLSAILLTVFSQTMFVAQMAFYNRVADPLIGGTYMTMLNTLANMGNAWPSTVAFFIVGQTTYKVCEPRPCDGEAQPNGVPGVVRNLLSLGKKARADAGCGCDDRTIVDGYVVTCLLSIVIGCVWLGAMKSRVSALQHKPLCDWHCAP